MAQINETAIKTPGVYINEIPLFPPSVAQVETAIPAFIGHTQKAENELGESLTNKPTKIFSLKEYERYFGGPENQSDIKVTVNQTTEGTSVVSLSAVAELPADKVSKYKMYYSLRLYFANGGGPCYIVSAGSTAANITAASLDAGLSALATSDEPTIIVIPDGLALAKDKYYELMGKAIDQCVSLQDRFTLIDVHSEGTNVTNTVTGFRTDFTKNDNLNYAAAYYPYLKTTFEYAYVDTAVNVVVVTNGTAAAAVKLNTLKITQTAIYNLCIDTINNKLSPTLAPSAAMAGIYARVDGSRGVWKAPANVSVSSVYGLSVNISDAEQGAMNIDATTGKSVNALRSFQGKGFLVWGARTLAGNDNEWRYVNVRRLFITVEESAKKATMQFVFEPNDANTWVKLRAMLENYLTLLWRQGALAGSKPEHAFYVRCGLNQTMTAQDILEGKLIVEIGMAAVRPAEFIILRFSHKMQES
ncbi:phage tail sheath family protein [Parapedobacter tibetensis]|uniref:phage tail sheath family protein n=1 Tax=Parapedobacter tibetensis TaxID=2972951 RepID=UPI00214D2EB2|nr:phage tail sheath C-terminal domain-containing protein [Parapedobacter tibetensis]